jgi:hypothetical protein
MNTQNRETLEKIAELMAHLPSDGLLKSDLTSDQIAEWEKCRKVQLLLAQQWRGRYVSNTPGYPIEEAGDRGEITKRQVKLYLLMVSELWERWQLVQVVEPSFKKWFELVHAEVVAPDFQAPVSDQLSLEPLWRMFRGEYPFKSDFDFFAQLIKEEVDDVFAACLEPYYEISAKKCGRVLNTISDFLSTNSQLRDMSPTVFKKIKDDLGWEKLEFNWWTLMILFCCETSSFVNPLVVERFNKYRDISAKALRVGTTETRYIRSRAWKQGILGYGDGRGGVYRFT